MALEKEKKQQEKERKIKEKEQKKQRKKWWKLVHRNTFHFIKEQVPFCKDTVIYQEYCSKCIECFHWIISVPKQTF
jgi:tartrate dehydratase alpha subunit/fumarate hydratase class I-like protein